MDRFVTPSECWQQAALCRARADAAADERLRAVWMYMALIWTKLAAHKERLQRLKAWGTSVTPLQKPKSRLEAHAPQCARCKAIMKVRILIPGRKVDDVAYRCEKCGSEVLRSVPRAW